MLTTTTVPETVMAEVPLVLKLASSPALDQTTRPIDWLVPVFQLALDVLHVPFPAWRPLPLPVSQYRSAAAAGAAIVVNATATMWAARRFAPAARVESCFFPFSIRSPREPSRRTRRICATHELPKIHRKF